MSKNYVSIEFDFRRISVIVHRSASDKIAVDLLVFLFWGTESYSSRERERVPGKLFPIKDLRFRIWQTPQVFT